MTSVTQPRGASHVLANLLAAVERIEGKLVSTASVSSVEVKTSARGTDVTVKVYDGSPIRSSGDAAIDEYIRVVCEVERRLLESV